jgi:hypothetical protein
MSGVSKQLPQGVPFLDKKGMIDYRWVSVLNALKAGLPPSGSGYVVDGSQTSYGAMTMYQGLEANRPVPPEDGDIYFALDTGVIYYESGGGWATFGEELTGDVTKPAGTTLTTLATVFASPGTYGAANLTPTLTVDGKGRVTDLSFQNIVADPAPPVGDSGELQFNNAGVMGGTNLITYNPVSGSLQFINPAPTRENLSPLTTKGDIFVRNATVSTRLPVGADGLFLRANSATATGLEWANDNTIEVRFNFGDASPKTIATVPANRVVRSTTITILTAFDAASSLTLGAPADLQASTDNLPTVAGTYDTQPGLQYAVNTVVSLTITPGSSTQGAGLVTITLEE